MSFSCVKWTCVAHRHKSIASTILSIVHSTSHDPFSATLFRCRKHKVLRRNLLGSPSINTFCPVSALSFKCRSSSSLPLTPSHSQSCVDTPVFEKGVGLGIYTSPYLPSPNYNFSGGFDFGTGKDGNGNAKKFHTYSFLSARPSLASLRTMATVGELDPPVPAHIPQHRASAGHPRPARPLPPIPVYSLRTARSRPCVDRAHRAVHAPMHTFPQHSTMPRTLSGSTLAADTSTPLTSKNLAAWRSMNSIASSGSSRYSRSASGGGKTVSSDVKRDENEAGRPRLGSRSVSAESGSSAGTVRRRPLGAMRKAEEPGVVVWHTGREEKS